MARKTLTDAQQAFLKTGSVEATPNGSPLSETELPLSKLIFWKKQPRKYFPSEHIQQLADSIRRQGLNYPLVVRPAGDHYEVIVGECRRQACQIAPHDPVLVKIQLMDDQQALELALSENLDRQDLNPIEVLDSLLKLLSSRLQLPDEKQVCSRLYDMKRDWETQQKARKKSGQIDEAKVPARVGDIDIPNPEERQQVLIDQTFKQYGYNWYSYTCNQLKLRDLPDNLYEAIAQGRIEYSKGLRFKSIKDEPLRTELLEQALAEGWSQREIQQRIKEKLLGPQEEAQGKKTQLTPQTRLTELTSRLKKSKLWQSHPKEWKKVENRLRFIEDLLKELETQAASD